MFTQEGGLIGRLAASDGFSYRIRRRGSGGLITCQFEWAAKDRPLRPLPSRDIATWQSRANRAQVSPKTRHVLQKRPSPAMIRVQWPAQNYRDRYPYRLASPPAASITNVTLAACDAPTLTASLRSRRPKFAPPPITAHEH